MARPGVTCLEYAIVAIIFSGVGSVEFVLKNQACPPSGRRVWARDYWINGFR